MRKNIAIARSYVDVRCVWNAGESLQKMSRLAMRNLTLISRSNDSTAEMSSEG
jgi:hypothetical protein